MERKPPLLPGSRLRSFSLFLPAFNEEANVERVVRQALEVLPRFADDVEVIVVDDGSVDRTAAIVEGLAARDPRVKLVRHGRNRGYGAALRSGFAAATREWVGYTDGDGQFDLLDIGRLLPLLADHDIVTGWRRNRQDGLPRKLNAFFYGRVLVPAVLGLRVRDVNCALKIYPRSLFDRIPLLSDGALIDAEVLTRAQRLGYRIGEVPVTHFPRTAGRQTGADLSVILRMFREVFALRRQILSTTDGEAPASADAR